MKKLVDESLAKGMVSIIVPVYNSEKYLRKCIESMINQSYKNIEIILIDDGSTDSSRRICEKYAIKDKRIKLLHKENSGPAAARNEGIKISEGEFIFFLDADDFIEKDALKLLIDCYNEQKADIIVGDFNKMIGGVIEKRSDISFPSNRLLTKKDIIDYSRFYLKKPNKYLLFAFGWGRLFKTSIIKEKNIYFDTNLHTFEDVAFNFSYLEYVKKLYFLKKPVYNHLIHDNYLSATMSIGGNPKKMFGYKKALVNIGDFLKNNLSEEDIMKEVGNAYIFLTIIQLVRTCGQINRDNKKKIYELIQETVNDSALQENIKFYSPSKGESKILPLLMRLKLINLIIWVCKYKANKRYRKGAVK